MAKKRAEPISGPLPGTWCGAAFAIAPLTLLSPAQAQSFESLAPDRLVDSFGAVAWWAITGGTALAALAAFGMLIATRRDERIAASEREARRLRNALDRTAALLDADDQRTIVWDKISDEPESFGGLPERVGAPVNLSSLLAFETWLTADSALNLEAACGRLRRDGEPFQIAVRTTGNGLLEAAGRTSGRRSVLRLRELTGERRSFAELKEQATFVIAEMAALRALADLIPFPLWRRNRAGRLVWVNAAYARAVEAENQEAALTSGVELLPLRTREAIRDRLRAGEAFDDRASAIVAGARRQLRVLDMPVEDGSVGGAVDQTELEAAHLQLRQMTESNARTLDRLAAGVAIFSGSGRILFHNAAFRAIWGLPQDWLEGAPDEGAILDRLRSERKLPEQSNYRDWRTRHLGAYREPSPREDLWHLPDGRTLRMVAVPNSDGGMSYIYENVTEQITLESRLAAQAQLQGETLDHLIEAVAVFGSDGRLRLFNPAFAEIWRLSPTQLKAEPHVGEIIANCEAIYAERGDWDAIRAAVTNIERRGAASGRMLRPDGSAIDYATVALPEGMTMLTFVDVTDSARVERVLKERNEALEAADRLKSEFVQHVSYELRTPLTNIIGQAELLAAETFGRLNRKQREYMADILASSDALRALINDILDLATVDAGIMALDLEDADIATLVEASVEALRDRLAEQRISLEIAVPKAIGTFRVDPQRVRQILFNLVSNAVRFSNADGHVRIAAEKRGGMVVFTITDDGIGIPEEMLASVFRPFETRAKQGRRAGAGLGLSIVKSLVELHGGRVEIRSEEGAGTTATVRLPIEPREVAVAAA